MKRDQGFRIGHQRPRALSVLLAVGMALLLPVLALAGQKPESSLTPMRALQQSHWVAEGSANPRHVVYVFVDANCPYCHTLWLALQAFRHDGLQVRNILVGVISASSPGKAAAVFDASDPAAAWRENEERWGSRSDGGGGVAPMAHLGAKDRAVLMSNELLMQKFGIPGTPGVAYADPRGTVHVVAGVPGAAELARIVQDATAPHH